MSTAFITGVTGQTGGYLAEHLAAEGWQLHGIVRRHDDLADQLVARVPGVVLHEGDLGEAAAIGAVIDEIEPDAVFNLGGLTSVAQSWVDPVLTSQITGAAVVDLLESSWKLRQRLGRRVSFVQASSAEIFGHASDLPQTEETRIRPLTPYGAAKAFAHHSVGVYRQLGLEASNAILYNHESPTRPEAFVTRKITLGVARIALGLSETVSLGNLDARRDWGWAPDYARALALAASGTPGDYIIATGISHTVRDFVAAAFAAVDIADWRERVLVDPAFARPQDAPEQRGDASRARDVLGWSPSVGFDDLVARMVLSDVELLSRGAGTP